MAKKRDKSDDEEINEGDGQEGEEQPAERLPWLSGERGIFDPDGVFTVDDLVHRTGMTPRNARAFLRDHVPCYRQTKRLIVFRGQAYIDAITGLSGPDSAGE